MFIKSLIISNKFGLIREINFNKGLNFIVDNTPIDDSKSTGNNVGKTTVLKLIDYCLSGDQKNIYTDVDAGKEVYTTVKDFLYETDLRVILKLKKDLDSVSSEEIIVERNFLLRNKAIKKINGFEEDNSTFEQKLKSLLFPDLKDDKPTFRQLIAHNIRYKDYAISNTINHIHPSTKAVEYESLFLYMFGCNNLVGSRKQELSILIKQETNFINRLENKQTKNAYEASLAMIDREVLLLLSKKENLNINKNFEHNLNQLNNVKYEISKISSSLTSMGIKRKLIEDSKFSLESMKSDIDFDELQSLYSQVKNLNNNIQKTFEEMVIFHNNMLKNKATYITKELPNLIEKIESKQKELASLIIKENELSNLILQSDSFDDLNNIVEQLNEKYRQKGEYENVISQIVEAEATLKQYSAELNELGNNLYSEKFQEKLKNNLADFNMLFSSISKELYDEEYLVKREIENDRQSGKPCYKFYTFNANIGSGKKQGEILSFDLAYIKFADNNRIPCMHFILNDKKELMDDNQLLKLEKLVEKSNSQVVISILKDKLPLKLQNNNYYAVQLSQDDKLFRIENK